MTIAEAEQFLLQTSGGPETHDFVLAAFEAKRLDLVKVGWRSSSSHSWIRDEAPLLPDSPFKEDVSLLMLRTDSRYWAYLTTYGSSGIFETTEPFTTLIRKYLPKVEPTLNLINTRATRLGLVAQIEEARKSKDYARPPAEAGPISLPSQQPPANAPNPNDPAPMPAIPPASVPEAVKTQSAMWLWICAIAAVCFGVAVALIKRGKND